MLSLLLLCLLAALHLNRINANDEVVATIADKKPFDESEVHARFHWKDIFVLGSHYEGVAVHETEVDEHWSVKAPLAFAFPNDGAHLKNAAELAGNIAVFKRSQDEHVLSAQPYKAQLANAKAVITVDFPESFEKTTALWATIYSDRLHRMYAPLLEEHTIPTVIISHKTFERITGSLDLVAGDLWTQDGVWEDQHLLRSSRYAQWFEPFPSDDHHDEL